MTTRSVLIEWEDADIIAQAGREMAGLDFLRALRDGRIPRPPVAALIGTDLTEVEHGRVVMRMTAAEQHYNPLGTVHGGVIATLLDSVMGCAVQSTLEKGRGYTTLEIKVNYVRALTKEVGVVSGEGRVVHAGRRSAVAEARLTDAGGRLYATASTTCLVFDLPPR
ncbi:PaaI family thioesterase [Acidisphaera rubrifaciens]|uniref:Thioesterase n=1 Tax=Acidisphaera rubrifaciens HS-AP3 TaxID=1231350 RepID=A0A0D6P4V8_9PROT|nr:PaaI family thioesterase [Acidisphaera rubrifaciens]GAN76795.1 thioesterase [Acidisphaera rubrifaciens HS-AP3]